jgi:hypothetical protein
MATDIETIRTMIGDQHIYDRAESAADGASSEFQLPHFPIQADTQTVKVDGSTKTETTDYTIDDEIGLVRMNAIPSTGVPVVITYKHSLLSDDQIQSMLDLNDDNIRLAAADCLDSIATSQALIQKRIKLLDLTTDGPALADSLRKQAKSLREQVLSPEFQEPSFEIIEQINDTAGYSEKIIKDLMREG